MTINKSMPLFSSAPRITLTIGQSLIGYAIGFNINISVDVQPIYAMGNYGPVALEPTFYNVVTGTMQIIRLSRPSARKSLIDLSNGLDIDGSGTTGSTAPDWNGAPTVTDPSGKTVTPVGTSNLYTHLDPSLVLISSLFDMTVQIQVPRIKPSTTVTSAETKTTTTIDNNVATEKVNWMAIRGCRLTGRTTNLTFGQIINEPINFNGLLVTPIDNNASASDVFNVDQAMKDITAT